MFKLVILNFLSFVCFVQLATAESSSLSNIKDGTKGEPVVITSDQLELETGNREFRYLGNVVLTKGELVIKADKVIGYYDKGNNIQRVVCRGNVDINKGDRMKATSDRAEYNVKKGVIDLTHGPEVIHDSNALSADKITLFVEQEKSKAEGNVRVRVIDGAKGSKEELLN